MKKYILLRIFLMLLPLLTILLFSYAAGNTGSGWDFNPGSTCDGLMPCGASETSTTTTTSSIISSVINTGIRTLAPPS